MPRWGEEEWSEWIENQYIDAYENAGLDPDMEHIQEVIDNIHAEGWDSSAHNALWDAYVELGYHDADDDRDVYY